MEDVLFYIGGLVIGAVGVYLLAKAGVIYTSLRAKLLKQGVPLSVIQFLEEQAREVVEAIEDDFDEHYTHDPDGYYRHSRARDWIEEVVEKANLQDKVKTEDIDNLIHGAVKGAGFVKDKNPYKQ